MKRTKYTSEFMDEAVKKVVNKRHANESGYRCTHDGSMEKRA